MKSIYVSIVAALAVSLLAPMPAAGTVAPAVHLKPGIGRLAPAPLQAASALAAGVRALPPPRTKGGSFITPGLAGVATRSRPAIAPTTASTWTELGPKPAEKNAYVTDTGTIISPYGNVSGRVNALAVDPTNPLIVYSATTGGGVWKSIDGGANWAPLTDTQPTIVTSSLAIDPNNHLVIYAGTGDRDGADLFGYGVLKSTDGGVTWVQQGAATLTGLSIGSIAIDRTTSGATQHVFAATDGGLWASTDGGTTWTQNTQINTVIQGALTVSGGVFQVIQDPTTASKFYATAADYCKTEAGQVLISTDSGTTWASSNNFPTLANAASRVQMGVGPGGVAYVVTAQCGPNAPCPTCNYQLYDIEKTTDGGTTWTPIPNTAPGYTDYMSSSAGGQGWYDNYVGVDPTNTARVIFGGIDLLATSDGGATFTNVGKVYNGGFVHPDQHAVAFFAASSFYLGNDGGVYKSTDMGGTALSSDWTNLNTTLEVTQYYHGSAIDSDHLIGGAQDNASPGRFAGVAGMPAAPAMLAYGGGDGGYVAIDPTPGSNTIYTSYVNGLVFKGSRTVQYARTLAAPCDENVATAACNDPVAFIAPFVMDPANPHHLLVATNKVYQSNSDGLPAGPGGWPTVSPVLTSGLVGDYISAMTEQGSGIITGSLMGAVFLSTNTGATWTNITGNLPAATNWSFLRPWISGIAVNPATSSEIWVSIGGLGVGRVYRTTNAGAGGGTIWADLSGSGAGSLPNLPTLAIAVDPQSSATIFVGNSSGVMACTTCGGATPAPAWLPLGTGLPNAMVKYLSFTADETNLVAWTFGRSAWMIQIHLPLPPLRSVLPAMANGAYGGYTTAAYIQNLGAAAAHVVVHYFDQTGSQVGLGDGNAALPVHASWTVRQDNGNSFASGGAGSALVYSDQPIATFVNEFAPANGDATSYTSIQMPAGAGTTLFAPTIVNGAYGGYTTGIGLVNVGLTATNLTITYRDAAGTAVKTQTFNGVAANAYMALYSGDATLALPAGFAGTATISSSAGALAAIVNEVGPGGQFSSYDAVPTGSTSLSAPVALNNAFGGYFTGMGVQNTSGSAGTVTVVYYDTSGVATTKLFNIAANGSLGIYQGSPTDGPAIGAYTAVLTSTVTIAVIVNEVAPAGVGPARQSTSYNTLAAATSTSDLALVTNASSDGWSTGEGIMNTGTTSTTATVTYYDAATGAPTGTPQSIVLAPHAFWGVYQPTAGLPAGGRATAVVTASGGGQVAVICNESSATSFMSYGGQ